jgi:hypothetical protein
MARVKFTPQSVDLKIPSISVPASTTEPFEKTDRISTVQIEVDLVQLAPPSADL